MSKNVMIFCDFCGRGFESDKGSVGAEADGEILSACEECAENLKILDVNAEKCGASVAYFAQYILDGVTLKNAYRALMRRKVFSLALASYAARLRPRPSQRQDGKTGVKASVGKASAMPPIIMEVGGSEKDGIIFGKPFYYGEKSEK
jgi:ribosomal protein L24E